MGAPRYKVPARGKAREQYFAKWRGLPACHKCNAHANEPCLRIASWRFSHNKMPDWCYMARPHTGRGRDD